jgi:hypothetical protein
MPNVPLPASTPRHGVGTSLELALAATVAIAVATYFREPRDSFFVAGHEHEQLSKGSVSVAWEGGFYDWPHLWSQSDEARAVGKELGVWFEPINGCALAVIREEN